jgi:uncharacterized membrane protein
MKSDLIGAKKAGGPMADHNFLVVKFPNSSDAFEAFALLGSVTHVKAAAVVARDEEGRLSVPEATGVVGNAFWTGSLVGALVGILGGPLGILLGWSAGALIGMGVEQERVADEEDTLTLLSRQIDRGSNVLMAEVEESNPIAVDAALNKLHGRTLRLPASEVRAEVEQADEQAKEAAAAARKARRAARREALHEKVRNWVHHGS